MFIRELISNASDALEKMRHKLVSEGQTLPEMEIHLQTDTEKGTLTIQVPHPCVLTSGTPPVRQSPPAPVTEATGQRPSSHAGLSERACLSVMSPGLKHCASHLCSYNKTCFNIENLQNTNK